MDLYVTQLFCLSYQAVEHFDCVWNSVSDQYTSCHSPQLLDQKQLKNSKDLFTVSKKCELLQKAIWFIDAKSFYTLVCLKISWVFRKILNKFSWQVCELSLVFDSNIIIYNMVNKNTLPLPQQHYHPFYQRSFCHPCWVVPKIVIKIVILLFIFYKSVGTIYQFKMPTGIW